MRFRVTVRGEGLELRGYVSAEDLQYLAAIMKPLGIVVASPAEDDYNPFQEKP